MSLQIRHVSLRDADSPLALADWRQRIAALYAYVQNHDDPVEAWKAWFETRNWLFKNHPMSPLPKEKRANYDGVPVYPYDPAWRFAVDVAPIDGVPITINVGADGNILMSPLCETVGLTESLGKELTIWWINGYGGGVFLPFNDLTNGTETYGGGRYLLDSIKGATLGSDEEGRIILDFNFAYFPSCAHNVDYVCPLSPSENALSVAIKAGERSSDC